MHTLVSEDQFGTFFANRLFTYVRWNNKNHAFIGFRITYMLCLYVSTVLISTVQEVYTEVKRKPSYNNKSDKGKNAADELPKKEPWKTAASSATSDAESKKD